MPLIRNLSWEDQSMWVAWTGASWRRVVADTRIERQTVRHYLNEWVWAGQVERKWTPTERRGGKPKPWYRRVR